MSTHPIAVWIQANLHRLEETPSERGMATVHLDELGLAPEDWRSLGSLSRIFAEAARAVEASAVWRKLLLSVVIEESEEILAPPETAVGPYLDRVSDTPPALYLADLPLWLSRKGFESYQLPLDVEVEGLAPGSYAVYLSQQRRLEDLRNGETYFNAITFEHYPPS